MKHNFTVRHGALDGVEAFLAVAQHRNFSKSAAELGVTPSAVSQAIRTLEARIGAPLFIRTTRSVGLTEAGQRFLSRAKPAFEELVAASAVARDLGQRPAGLLRLAVPRAAVPIVLEPLIASFCQAYPDVEVEISASEELVDLATGGFDAGVRLGQFIAADMIAIRLTPPFRSIVIGSPGYLARSGRPKHPDDLRHHACLRMRRSGGALAPWPLDDHGRAIELAVSGPLIANDYPTLRGDRGHRPGATARAGRGRRDQSRQAGAGAGRVCADGARGVSLLSGAPPDHAEAAGVHRSREATPWQKA